MKSIALTTAAFLAVATTALAAELQRGPSFADELDRSIASDSPTFKDVTLKITSPQEGEVRPASDFAVRFALKGYELLGGATGPFIHVIVDNDPPLVAYAADKPLEVKGLAPGPHTLRAFVSRPWHEAVKTPKAFALVHFFIDQKPDGKPTANWIDARRPVLTYAGPMGNYAGDDAQNVMVDFFVSNAKLSGHGPYVTVRVDDGQPQMLSEWKPLPLTGLTDGPHKVVLDLVDAHGRPIRNTFNHTERTFTVNTP